MEQEVVYQTPREDELVNMKETLSDPKLIAEADSFSVRINLPNCLVELRRVSDADVDIGSVRYIAKNGATIKWVNVPFDRFEGMKSALEVLTDIAYDVLVTQNQADESTAQEETKGS